MTDDRPRSREQVRETYDEIAEHFSKTRQWPWPEVESFLDLAPAGAVGLDIGCGNGRHLPVLLETVDRAIGLDISRGILAEALDHVDDGAHSVNLLLADAGSMPLRSETVDVAISVAAVHHLPDRRARVGCLEEHGRVLAPAGTALVSAWSTTHERFDRSDGFDTTVDWTLPDGETVPRFYHIYSPDEFRADLETAGLDVLMQYEASGNCYAEVRP